MYRRIRMITDIATAKWRLHGGFWRQLAVWGEGEIAPDRPASSRQAAHSAGSGCRPRWGHERDRTTSDALLNAPQTTPAGGPGRFGWLPTLPVIPGGSTRRQRHRAESTPGREARGSPRAGRRATKKCRHGSLRALSIEDIPHQSDSARHCGCAVGRSDALWRTSCSARRYASLPGANYANMK